MKTFSLSSPSQNLKTSLCFLDDLHHWHASFEAPLRAALQFLVLCDADAVEALLRTQSKLDALCEQAIFFVEDYAKVARQARNIVPTLHSSNTYENTISMFIEWLSDAKGAARGLRAAYKEILEDMHYIIKCVGVSTEDASLNEGEEKLLASTAVSNHSPLAGIASQASHCVPMALKHLNQAQRILGDCSDAWLSIHTMELMLSKTTKLFKKITMTCPETISVTMQTSTLRSAVESIYQLYGLPLSGSRRGGEARRLAA